MPGYELLVTHYKLLQPNNLNCIMICLVSKQEEKYRVCFLYREYECYGIFCIGLSFYVYVTDSSI